MQCYTEAFCGRRNREMALEREQSFRQREREERGAGGLVVDRRKREAGARDERKVIRQQEHDKLIRKYK